MLEESRAPVQSAGQIYPQRTACRSSAGSPGPPRSRGDGPANRRARAQSKTGLNLLLKEKYWFLFSCDTQMRCLELMDLLSMDVGHPARWELGVGRQLEHGAGEGLRWQRGFVGAAPSTGLPLPSGDFVKGTVRGQSSGRRFPKAGFPLCHSFSSSR